MCLQLAESLARQLCLALNGLFILVSYGQTSFEIKRFLVLCLLVDIRKIFKNYSTEVFYVKHFCRVIFENFTNAY